MKRILACLALLAACDGATAPAPALPATGTYNYASPGVGGTLTLTTATQDVLSGQWAASTPAGSYPATFTAVRQGGEWVSVEVVNASPPRAPWVTVHKWRVERGQLACTANGGTCTVTRR